MNAIPDPIGFKPEPEGGTPAERATFQAIYRIEKQQKAQRGEFFVRLRALEEKLATMFGDLVGDLLALRDRTIAKLSKDSEVQQRQITACENRQADSHAALELFEHRLDDASDRQRIHDAAIDDRFASLTQQITILEQGLERLADERAAAEQRCAALQAEYEQRLAQLERDTAAELAKAARNGEALLADNVAMRRELELAKDVTAALRQAELHHERAAALRDESKRGPRGEKGARGERGQRGDTGRAGKDGVTTVRTELVVIKKWEVDRQAYAIRPILSDGIRLAAIPVRGLFEQFRDDMDL